MPTTKTKRTKLPSVRPPREIRDNTKARRAWLDEQLALIQGQSNREAKIVGKGSYQEISVWELSEVEGRLRHRGHCQFCGAQQVVQGEAIVFHGYERPGLGYTLGRCPGTSHRALNIEKLQTERWLQESHDALESSLALEKATELLERAAQEAYRASDEAQGSAGLLAKPRRPAPPLTKLTEDATKRRYAEAMEVWKKQFPLTAEAHRLADELSKARNSVRLAQSRVQHFDMLLSYGYYGKPLKEEVVAS